MDEQTRKALDHLIKAVEELASSVWHVEDLALQHHVVVLPQNRNDIVTSLLNDARAIVQSAGGSC